MVSSFPLNYARYSILITLIELKMPNKKKRRKLQVQREKRLRATPSKPIYKITKKDEIIEIIDIYCDVCGGVIDCECIIEQHIPNFKRLCATQKTVVFPRSQFMMKGKQFDLYIVHICSRICDEQFKITSANYLEQVKKYNPEINVCDFI